MAFELVYTSVPVGIQNGRSGFCIAAYTMGMSTNVAHLLEGLSGYKPCFQYYDDHAGDNPVSYSHYMTELNGETLHVFSRVCYYGLDYTQRSNKLAHHVVLKAAERNGAPDGPSTVFRQNGLFRSEWKEEPQLFKKQLAVRAPSLESRRASLWEQYTGDAGWAAVLADEVRKNPSAVVTVVFDPLVHRELLGLVEESLMLLEPAERWSVSFNTYMTLLPAGMQCNWRFCVADSDLLRDARRKSDAVIIDLTSPLPPAPDSAGAEFARTGVKAVQAAEGSEAGKAPRGPGSGMASRTARRLAPPQKGWKIPVSAPGPAVGTASATVVKGNGGSGTGVRGVWLWAVLAGILLLGGAAAVFWQFKADAENDFKFLERTVVENAASAGEDVMAPEAAEDSLRETVTAEEDDARETREQWLKAEAEKERQARLAEKARRQQEQAITKTDAPVGSEDSGDPMDKTRRFAFMLDDVQAFQRGESKTLKLAVLKPGERVANVLVGSQDGTDVFPAGRIARMTYGDKLDSRGRREKTVAFQYTLVQNAAEGTVELSSDTLECRKTYPVECLDIVSGTKDVEHTPVWLVFKPGKTLLEKTPRTLAVDMPEEPNADYSVHFTVSLSDKEKAIIGGLQSLCLELIASETERTVIPLTAMDGGWVGSWGSAAEVAVLHELEKRHDSVLEQAEALRSQLEERQKKLAECQKLAKNAPVEPKKKQSELLKQLEELSNKDIRDIIGKIRDSRLKGGNGFVAGLGDAYKDPKRNENMDYCRRQLADFLMRDSRNDSRLGTVGLPQETVRQVMRERREQKDYDAAMETYQKQMALLEKGDDIRRQAEQARKAYEENKKKERELEQKIVGRRQNLTARYHEIRLNLERVQSIWLSCRDESSFDGEPMKIKEIQSAESRMFKRQDGVMDNGM